MPMTWWKKLSVTDAQRPTTGRLVPYLRMTKGKNPQNNQTWFRFTFFANEPWTNGHFGQHAVERVEIDFPVSILGQNRGVRTMLVTHDGSRQNNNNAPNTWLHYDDATLADFHAQNLAHRIARLSKSDTGVYSFTIT